MPFRNGVNRAIRPGSTSASQISFCEASTTASARVLAAKDVMPRRYPRRGFASAGPGVPAVVVVAVVVLALAVLLDLPGVARRRRVDVAGRVDRPHGQRVLAALAGL